MPSVARFQDLTSANLLSSDMFDSGFMTTPLYFPCTTLSHLYRRTSIWFTKQNLDTNTTFFAEQIYWIFRWLWTNLIIYDKTKFINWRSYINVAYHINAVCCKWDITKHDSYLPIQRKAFWIRFPWCLLKVKVWYFHLEFCSKKSFARFCGRLTFHTNHYRINTRWLHPPQN